MSPEKVIPPHVLAGAKVSQSPPHNPEPLSPSLTPPSSQQGLAILTVIKAGFLGSARFGSGLVVARLPDGSWSAPSAIATGGAGFGGQIGFELTDFVFILNDASAVKTFSQAGSLTLGGNVSIAAGPIGRNAEAAGAASLRSVAGIFSYSKTKGLFAGVSLEGSAIIERKEANARLYGRQISARELLTGSERPPPQAAPLLSILNSRAFNGISGGGTNDDRMYNDTPVYDDQRDDVVWAGKAGPGYKEGQQRDGGYRGGDGEQGHDEFGRPKRSTTWQDDVYDHQPRGVSRANTFHDSYGGGETAEKKAGPGRPAAPKPNYASKQALLKKNEAVALFNFDADQPGDLGFKKGDIITVLKKTESETDWWYVPFSHWQNVKVTFRVTNWLTLRRTGMIGTTHGIFPSNYVKMKE